MSRSGYTDDMDDQWAHIRWRGAVNSAISGRRGQQALHEIAAALDAMPEKRLTTNDLEAEGEFCTLGVLGAARGIDLKNVDPDDPEAVADLFNLSPAMVREIVFENDEAVDDYVFEEYEVCGPMRERYPDWESHKRTHRVLDPKAAEKRWFYMRRWVESNIKKDGAA